MNYEEIMKRGIRRTIISFDPFLKREDVRGLTDAQVGKKFGLATKTVKAMRLHQDVPFETIQILCHQLQCQPGEILNAIEVYTIPAKGESPDAWQASGLRGASQVCSLKPARVLTRGSLFGTRIISSSSSQSSASHIKSRCSRLTRSANSW